MENIHKNLTENSGILLLVNGIGGIGKTTTAQAYVNSENYTKNYEHLAWITVISDNLKDEFTTQLSNSFTGYVFDEPQNLNAHFKQLIQHLNCNFKNTLLIIDNANNKQQLAELQQDFKNLGWTILITSRAKLDNYETLPLEKLKPEFAYKLFTKHFKKRIDTSLRTIVKQSDNDEKIIQNILEKIEYHSLLTVLLAKTAQNNHILTLQKLLHLIENNQLSDEQLQININLQLTDDKKDFLEIKQLHKYIIAIFETNKLTEKEQHCLRMFSVFPALRNIEFSLIAELFQTPENEKTELNNTLNSLDEKGWLTNQNTCYHIHPLIQNVSWTQLKPTPENCLNIIKGFIKIIDYDEFTSPITKKEWLPFGESLDNCFNQYVDNFLKNKNIENIEPIIRLANSFNNYSLIYRYLGNFQKAREFQLKVIEINEKVLDKNHPNLASSYNNLSLVYSDLDNLQKALEFQSKTTAIFEKVFDKEHPNLATSYNNLSVIYSSLDDLQKALEFQLKAIEIREKVLDKEHPDLATSYNNLSAIYSKLSDLQKALEFQMKVIEINEKVLDKNHPDLATSYNNLSLIYEHLSDLQKAMEFQMKAIEIKEKALDKNHPDLAISYNNLATIFYEKKDKIQAQDYNNLSIKIFEYNFPNGHSNLETAKWWREEIEKM